MMRGLTLLALLVAPLCQAQWSSEFSYCDPTSNDVTKLFNEYSRAFAQRDVNALKKIVSPEFWKVLEPILDNRKVGTKWKARSKETRTFKGNCYIKTDFTQDKGNESLPPEGNWFWMKRENGQLVLYSIINPEIFE